MCVCAGSGFGVMYVYSVIFTQNPNLMFNASVFLSRLPRTAKCNCVSFKLKQVGRALRCTRLLYGSWGSGFSELTHKRLGLQAWV